MRRIDRDELPSLVDLPVAARISAPQNIGRGYCSYERYEISLPGSSAASEIERDVLRSGQVVGILPIDIQRDEVVLIRQFRLASHIALGKGTMIEIPAGRAGPRESTEQAAFRECYEETGAYPLRLIPLFSVMPAPALSDECMMLYAASVEAAQVKARTGCADEQEDIEPITASIDAAVGTLRLGGVHNSVAIIALQWLALNREMLPAIFASAETLAGSPDVKRVQALSRLAAGYCSRQDAAADNDLKSPQVWSASPNRGS
jgi:ADP-ribose pyrophosphatase